MLFIAASIIIPVMGLLVGFDAWHCRDRNVHPERAPEPVPIRWNQP
jgi:heme/copper-type cytochrome/quinol oxidase subunit 2